MDMLLEISDNFEMKIVENAVHAFGLKYK